MSKVEQLRALREAKWARENKYVPKKIADKVEIAAEMLCNHVNMQGKTCIRPKDHTEKNHRYK